MNERKKKKHFTEHEYLETVPFIYAPK